MSKKLLASALLAATVLGELAKATDLKPTKDEELKDFAPRVATATSQLADADFDKLSKPAQDYFNAVAAAVNEEKDVPEPPKGKGVKAEAAADEKEAKVKVKPRVASTAKAAEAPAKPAKGKIKVKAKAAPAKEAKTKTKAKSNGAVQSHSRTDGVAKSIFKAVVAKPAITFEDTVSKLDLKGQEVGGYAWTRWNDARQVMAIVNEKRA